MFEDRFYSMRGENKNETKNGNYHSSYTPDSFLGLPSGRLALLMKDVPAFTSTEMPNRLFTDMQGLETINLSQYQPVSTASGLSGAFSGCKSLKNLDLRTFDTTNATDMGAMFEWCESLKSIDASNFNTANVTNMNRMFCECKSLESIIGIYNFNVDKVSNIEEMFCGCEKLDIPNILDLFCGSYALNRPTSMFLMFKNCKSLSALNKPDTSKLTARWACSKTSRSEKL